MAIREPATKLPDLDMVPPPLKLPLTMIYCSSEDPHFPISELTRPVPTTRGWQSLKQSGYPQQIGFRFDGAVFLEQIQILVHESKIPSKIELFTCEPIEYEGRKEFPPFEIAPFRYRGYISFSSNRDAKFKSGELKACLIQAPVLYVKLVLWEPHENPLNFFGQVGLSAVTCVGTLKELWAPSPSFPHQRNSYGGVTVLMGKDDDLLRRPPHERIEGAAGSGKNTNFKLASPIDRLMYDLHYDQTVLSKIKELAELKERSLLEENYEAAKRIKEYIDALYPIAMQIQHLESRKRQAVLQEDFQLSHILKTDIDELRAQAAAFRVIPNNNNNSSSAKGSPSRVHLSGPSPVQSISPGRSLWVAGGLASTVGLSTTLPPTDNKLPSSSTPLKFDVMPSTGSGIYQPPMGPSEPAGSSPNRLPLQRNPSTTSGSGMVTGAAAGGGGFDDVPAVASNYQPGAGFFGGGFNDDDGGIQQGGGANNENTARLLDTTDMLHYDQQMARLVTAKSGDSKPPEDVRAFSTDIPTFAEILNGLGLYATCCLFSKRHQLREAAALVLTEKADQILQQTDSNQVVNAIVMACGTRGAGLHDPVNNVFFASVEMLRAVLGGRYHGNCSQALKNFHGPLIPALMNKLSDANIKVRTLALEMLFALEKHSSVGVEQVCRHATPTSGKPNSNFRAYLGRLEVVSHALESVIPAEVPPEQFPPSLQLERLMQKLVNPALAHAHVEVRERAVDVVCLIHYRYGAVTLQPYLNQLKTAQRSMVEERLGKSLDSHNNGKSSSKLAPKLRSKVNENRQQQQQLPAWSAPGSQGMYSSASPSASPSTMGGGVGVSRLRGKNKGDDDDDDDYDENEPEVVLTSSYTTTKGNSKSHGGGGGPAGRGRGNNATTKGNGNKKTGLPVSVPNGPAEQQLYGTNDEDGYDEGGEETLQQQSSSPLRGKPRPKNNNLKLKSPTRKPQFALGGDPRENNNNNNNNATNTLTSGGRDKQHPPATDASGLPLKLPPRRNPPKPISGECQFCGLQDKAFEDHDELVQHFMAECPFLCSCPLCQLPIEIRDIHNHLAQDCQFKSRLRQCPRCAEAVRQDEYDAHVKAKKCTPWGADFLLCPLCKAKLPDNDALWEVHIQSPPFCPANPRTAQ